MNATASALEKPRVIIGAGGVLMLASAAYDYLTGSVTTGTFLMLRTGTAFLIGAIIPPCEFAVQRLRAKLSSLAFITQSGVSRRGVALDAPHWERERDSVEAAVFTVPEVGAATAVVEIHILESQGQPGTGVLSGTMGEVSFRCEACPLR